MKETFLNSLEKHHIFLASKQEIHINDFNINHSIPIFEMTYQKHTKHP
jgi:hypothetical protein